MISHFILRLPVLVWRGWDLKGLPPQRGKFILSFNGAPWRQTVGGCGGRWASGVGMMMPLANWHLCCMLGHKPFHTEMSCWIIHGYSVDNLWIIYGYSMDIDAGFGCHFFGCIHKAETASIAPLRRYGRSWRIIVDI